MSSRTFTVAAAVVSAAILATGITYASTDGFSRAEPAAERAGQPAHRAAPPDRPAAPAPAPLGSEGGTESKGAKGGDHEGSGRGGHDGEGSGREGRDDEGGGRDRGYDGKREERIYFNERAYSAHSEGCVSAASGLGSSSFSIYNNSRNAVEVFRGFACDGGSPVATVGPYGSTYGVATPDVQGGGFIDNGVVGSFRVIGHDEW
ncbi:hypothetical protein ACIO87_21180 [Streptomyces sp. NPDC087218]|uniref:hypothetical protein n=1 Tax=Streptomyces sp. NPDC087218 TaxID=3365769 RepID=UPI0037FB10E5